MPVLTKTQLEHAKMRVTEAKKKYVYAQFALLGKQPQVASFSVAEKLDMIFTGNAAMKDPSVNHWGYVVDAFTYPLTPEQAQQQAAADAWDVQADAITAKANAIEIGLIDELIMSPDGVSALKRIADAFAV